MTGLFRTRTTSQLPDAATPHGRLAGGYPTSSVEPAGPDDEELPPGVEEGEAPSADELERAYQNALAAIESAESLFSSGLMHAPSDEGEPPQETAESSAGPVASAIRNPPLAAAGPSAASASAAQSPHGLRGPRSEPSPDTSDAPPISPAQIVEAILFVGGAPITGKKLAAMIGPRVDGEAVEAIVAALNSTYLAEKRPYEIQLREGGYRLELRPEYDAVRARIYGVGPREVKLSQEALELLALVAYQQPVAHRQVLAMIPKQANAFLRQLLCRELIAMTRTGPSRDEVEYRTTPRFLQLFNLASLHDLPRLESLDVR